eukprot:CAMPEP_0182471210 /NCGR_PEP_ID=MMETSP1319-20130603/19906_1 /TAXON_ID=172717 /ORGANISM="Bolidomonas pacifica, Strain RCC208" /LENGTH=302 /DNA_ID=CAMNT_0024671735 /DNA_START=251 /DNA_END=1155 /DNA_ORIENTATION=+
MSTSPHQNQQHQDQPQQGTKGKKRKAEDVNSKKLGRAKDNGDSASLSRPETSEVVKFTSKITQKNYLLPASTVYHSLSNDPFRAWCFKKGKRVDSRLDEYPARSHAWSSALQKEAVDFFTIVILDDKEVAMIDRMLGGRREEGCSAYKHLSVICNLEDNMIRAYVRLGKEVEGHPFGQNAASSDLKVNLTPHTISNRERFLLSKIYPAVYKDELDREDNAAAAKIFKNPRLVYTGKSCDGISTHTLARLWKSDGNRSVNNRTLCAIFGRQESKIAYFGELVVEDGKQHRGIRGWRYIEDSTP